MEKVALEWAVDEKTRSGIRQAPSEVRSLFSGDRLVIYALMPSGLSDLSVTLKAELGGRQVQTTVHTTDLLATEATVQAWLA